MHLLISGASVTGHFNSNWINGILSSIALFLNIPIEVVYSCGSLCARVVLTAIGVGKLITIRSDQRVCNTPGANSIPLSLEANFHAPSDSSRSSSRM